MAEGPSATATYLDATRRGILERNTSPIPVSVRYDVPSKRVVVEFSNGSAFWVPARALQGLETASDEDLSAVELLGETGLHWERLDVDFRISGLMAGIFGTAAFMKASLRDGTAEARAGVAGSRTGGAEGRSHRKTV